MKRFNLLLFFLYSLSTVSFAQNNYKPGYIIKLNGDTVKGFIDHKQWSKNPDGIDFKTSITDGTGEHFTTATISAFSITGYEHFKRFVVKVSQDATYGYKVSVGINQKQITDTVFLKLLSSGKYITLYSYNDVIKNRYYTDENTGNPTELLLHAYVTPDNKVETQFIESYKRQLSNFAVKYRPQDSALLGSIQTVGYNEDAIKKIVFAINGSDKVSEYISPEKYRFRLIAGIGISKMNVSNFSPIDIPFYTPGQNQNYSVKTAIAEEAFFGEEVSLSKNEQSIIFRTSLNFSYSANNKILSKFADSVLETYKTFTISINPQFLFNVYNKPGAKIYLGVGAEAFVVAGSRGSDEVNYFDFAFPARNEFDISLTTSAEIRLKNRLVIFAGYDPVSTFGQKKQPIIFGTYWHKLFSQEY